MVEQIKPTRSELIKLKKQIKLAKSGHSLLKKKRDGLILEFFDILKKARTIRQELVELYRSAHKKMNIARSIEGDLKVKSLAMAIKERPDLGLETKNIMGVHVPKIEFSMQPKRFHERGYGIYNSASIDEAAFAYEEIIKKVMIAAEVENAMRKILVEIEKTKRRVNALEFNVIPKMDSMKRFVQFRLEEMERENMFRMKHLKSV